MIKRILSGFQTLDARLPDILGTNRLSVFIKENAKLLVYLSIAGLIAYAYDFFSFALKIDSENHAYIYGPVGAWVSQGRWGMYLLSYLLLPDVVMPFIPTLIAVSGCVVGALFFVLTLSDKRGIADYLAAPIAIACPVVYFALYFTTLGYGVGVAFAVSSLGIYLLKRFSWFSTLVAILCFTLGIGIYQAVLPLIATLFCLYLVSRILSEQNLPFLTIFRQTLHFIIVVALAAGLSNLISRWVMQWLNISFDSGYMMSFINYQPTPEYFRQAIQKALFVAWDYYTGSKNYYLYDLLLLKILFVLTLTISVGRIAIASCSWLVKIIGLLCLLAALAAPMLMHVLNSGYMPPRTVLGVSYVLAGLIFFTVSSSSHLLRFLTGILAVACFYNFSMVNNRYAFSDQMVWLADRELSVQLLDKIHEAINKLPRKTDPNVQIPLEIVGWSEYPETPVLVHREVIGSSFYTWGAGDVERIVKLFKSMGVSDYRYATHAEKISVVENAKLMPPWPYEGSVDIINGIVVVKLSEYNPNQFLNMCQPPDDINPVCMKYMPH
jgi:hypothetical protein